MKQPTCPACHKPLTTPRADCAHCGYPDRTQAISATSRTQPRQGGEAGGLPGRMGQYRIVRELGRGGMGRVLEAVDEPLGRRVAIKILLTPAEKETRRRRFVEEARITGGLEHPGIAPVYSLGKNPDGSDFFSMKLVAGRDLGDILKDIEAGKRDVIRDYPLSRLLSIFERVVETIAYAHSRRILHRDLKPANIMIGTHGEVWVLDWGLAKVIGTPDLPEAPVNLPVKAAADLTVPGQLLGTAQYMAPEQAKSRPLDQRTDIYGLGAILYRILTGQPPNQGADYVGTLMQAALAEVKVVRNTARGRRAPRVLAAIAEKCLAPRPDQRYASADLLLADLRAYAAGEAVQARPDGLPGKLFRLVRKHSRAAVIMGGALALLLLSWTVAATIIAALDRRALEAERQVADSAARAQRRMQAFTPYAEATDLLTRGQFPDRAAGLLEEALKIDAEFPEAQFALGEARRLAGNPAAAADAYMKANTLSRQLAGRPHLQALLAAGMTYDGAGDYARSEEAFLQAEQEGAHHPLALVGKAFRLCHERRFRGAKTAADEALRLGPHLWETHFASGYVLHELTDAGLVPPDSRNQAIAQLRQALELSPRQAEAMVWLARALRHGGSADQRGEAQRLFDQAIALEPRNGNRYINRAMLRINSHDMTGGEADLRKARELGAAHTLILNAETMLAHERGDVEKAYQMLGELVKGPKAWPPNVANWLVLGFNLKRDAEVRPRYEEWCRQNPEYPEVFALRAQLKAREKDFPGAIAEDRAGLKLAPYNRKLRTQLAVHLAYQRNWPESLKAADAALELTPQDYLPQIVRAQCLGQLGRGDEARGLLNQLEKDFPARFKEIEEVRRMLGQKPT